MFKNWKILIEASAQELSIMPTFNIETLDHFKNGRLAYFRNDMKVLKMTYEFFKKNSKLSQIHSICADIFKNRLFIRTQELDVKNDEIYELSKKYNLLHDNISKLLKVELLSVEAIACDINKIHDLCKTKNNEAFKLAKKMGLDKKSSILFYNGIVSQNHKTPAHLRLSELNDSIILSQKCNDIITEVAARTSLSNEYKILGCIELAYKEIIKALTAVSANHYGSFNHGACIVSYIKICILTERISTAKESLILLKTFDFKEFEPSIENIEKDLTYKKTGNSKVLSGDEQKVIEFLSFGSKSKHEIIDSIYGKGDFESFDNRLKQLLVRVRKKKGSIINFNKINSKYELIV